MRFGGDDITDYWTRLLLRSSFPWQDVDLAKSTHRQIMDRLKERWCTLIESDVAMQHGECVIRNHNQKTRKFPWRMYEEVFLAPMVYISSIHY
jgi:actin-related protein 8